MCATLLEVHQQLQGMSGINIPNNPINTSSPEASDNDVVLGYLSDGTPVTESVIALSRKKANEAFARGECATQEELVRYTDMLIIKSKRLSGKPVVGYEPDGTPITEYDYFLRMKEALQQYAQDKYSSHEEVMQEMNDYITHVSHEKKV
jgi:hypothetical protein